jgi:hypothetical protein
MFSLSGFSQNYIGLHKDEIRMKVKQELPGFAFTKEIYNDDRSFIKFENSFEEQTIVFMLNSNGYCTSISRMYNTWLFNRIKGDLIAKYGKSKNNKWVDIEDTKKYEIELIKGEWFITVVTRKK